MSLPQIETIECPNCSQPQQVTIWASVNVTVDPELKQTVLDGSITRFRCEACGYSTRLVYDVLYHDMTKCLVVWLKYPDEGESFSIDPTSAAMSSVLGDTYIRRIVPSFEELIEKIKIVDAGLEDIDIELFKLLVCMREEIDTETPFVFSGLKKSLLTGKTAVFSTMEHGHSRDRSYQLESIQETVSTIRSRLPKRPQDAQTWPHVNRDYVLERLSEAGLMKLIP